jgi:hypothetical protein
MGAPRLPVGPPPNPEAPVRKSDPLLVVHRSLDALIQRGREKFAGRAPRILRIRYPPCGVPDCAICRELGRK